MFSGFSSGNKRVRCFRLDNIVESLQNQIRNICLEEIRLSIQNHQMYEVRSCQLSTSGFMETVSCSLRQEKKGAG
jgi:hypothetical protein